MSMQTKRQAGWTVWSLLFVATFIISLALLFMALFPHYFDNMKIQQALETLSEDPQVTKMDRGRIVQELDKILYIDYGHQIVNLRDAVSVSKNKTDMIINVNYEIVEPLVLNVSALLEFDNRIEIPLR